MDRRNDDTVLIQAAFDTILDIVRVLRTDATDGELRVFYADLMVYCVIITKHLERITKSGTSLNRELFESIVARLGAILTLDTSVEISLRQLHARWDEVRTKDNAIKIQFIGSTLAFGGRHDQRMNFIDMLASWEGDVRARYPEERLWTAEDFAPQQKISKPCDRVCDAAQAVFKAMAACQNCGCIPAHEFGARLCLGTYRRSDADADGNIGFDMFLSVRKDWQEVRVHTAREKVIRFADEGEAPPSQPKTPAARVQRLCVPIVKAKKMMTVQLRVTNGKLFWVRSERSNRLVDLTKSPVSLGEFLRGGPRAFTDKTKRILVVLLSYTVLHLHDTPWLQSTWSSSDILFFRTKDSEIPLRPFLQTRLSEVEEGSLQLDEQAQQAGQSNGDEFDDFDPDDIDPDELMQHPCPTIVTLAIVLMEVYFVTPFDDLAQKLNVEVAGDASCFMRYLAASMVFEACRNEIPDLVLYAIDKCLSPATWEDEDGNRLVSQALRSKMYEEIVRPLENDLHLAYSSIVIEDLDRFAQEMDFTNWDQSIRNQQAQDQDVWDEVDLDAQTPNPLIRPAKSMTGHLLRSHPHHHSSQTTTPLADQHIGVYQVNRQSSDASGIFQRVAPVSSGEADYTASKFFDDEMPTGGQSPGTRAKYSRWKLKQQDVYKRFITSCIDSDLSSPHVKVAILDTGIDLNHPDMQACTDNIKAKRNWLREGNSSAVYDVDGHGTFVTSLLHDYVPDADIYIAKIADKEPTSPRVIAKAITHAVNVWGVDVVSMSFGFPTRDIDGYEELESAIKHAHYRDVLLFAAASNSGGQLERAYPAREASVVCVYSTDAHGNRSPFSPTAVPEDVNLATVGEAVESAWPLHLCCSNAYYPTPEDVEEGAYSTVKSGTSYATPIMAGIAAFLLLYARLNLPDKAHLLKRRRRMIALLQRIAQKGQGRGLRDGYYFVDVSLYSDTLFGKDKVYIDQTIGDILNN